MSTAGAGRPGANAPRRVRAPATVTGSVASLVARYAGRQHAGAALAALLRAVEEADARRSERAVLVGDLLSCFAAVPGPDGKVMLRAFWYVDEASNRKIVVRVQPEAGRNRS